MFACIFTHSTCLAHWNLRSRLICFLVYSPTIHQVHRLHNILRLDYCESWFRKVVEWSGRGLFNGIVLKFFCGDWGRPQSRLPDSEPRIWLGASRIRIWSAYNFTATFCNRQYRSNVPRNVIFTISPFISYVLSPNIFLSLSYSYNINLYSSLTAKYLFKKSVQKFGKWNKL